ncbi:hypothetical protein NGC02_11525 [Mammaliicoccus sciuri]|nr:hypothetical protein [Mammaliicoccus sciuri]
MGYADSGGIRKQFTNKAGYQNTYEIINVLWGYLSNRLENDQLYRTIGISFGKFIPNQIKQLSLFDDPLKIKTEIIENQLDVIRFELPTLILFLTKSRIEVYGFLGTKHV